MSGAFWTKKAQLPTKAAELSSQEDPGIVDVQTNAEMHPKDHPKCGSYLWLWDRVDDAQAWAPNFLWSFYG